MAALLRIALRTAEAAHQEVAQSLLGPLQIVGRVHGSKNRVAGNLPIEGGDEAREPLLANTSVHVELVHGNDVTLRVNLRAMKPSDCILFSGGAPGAEAAFGACAERHGVEEVNFTFDGHGIDRHRGVRMLNHEELLNGDVSLEYVSRLMHRRYTDSPTIRKVLQTLWYQINTGQEIYVVGVIQDDDTVRGGTGWGTEFAKLCNKPLFVFDQDRNGWFGWSGSAWDAMSADAPRITHPHFTGTGTRHLKDNAKQAIDALFDRSFES